MYKTYQNPEHVVESFIDRHTHRGRLDYSLADLQECIAQYAAVALRDDDSYADILISDSFKSLCSSVIEDPSKDHGDDGIELISEITKRAIEGYKNEFMELLNKMANPGKVPLLPSITERLPSNAETLGVSAYA